MSILVPILLLSAADPAQDTPPHLALALELAGDNRAEIEQALATVPADMRAGMEFLIENAPEEDLRSLEAAFLLHHCEAAYRAWREAPWHDQVPEDVFLDAILPYASVTERRNAWREELRRIAAPMVEGVDSPGLAAARINRKLFAEVGVKYSTERPKADQSPAESIAAGTASCTGLSILLIDACRAVGVPARFAGTPSWIDGSGNHSWVEVWSDGAWHHTGAAEAAGDRLDEAWFTERATTARRDDPKYAIYAACWRRTPVTFPPAWVDADGGGPTVDVPVHAVNVTDRYTATAEPLAEGFRHLRLRVLGPEGDRRVAARLTVTDERGEILFEGTSKDEGFDANDHVTLTLAEGSRVVVEGASDQGHASEPVRIGDEDRLVTLRLRQVERR